jgi:hypothetical protein
MLSGISGSGSAPGNVVSAWSAPIERGDERLEGNKLGWPSVILQSGNGTIREGLMSEQDLYIIRLSGEGWAVHLADVTLGRFDERPKAIEAAVVVAEASARLGRVAGVVMEEGDQRIIVWDAGRDTYSRVS